MLRLASGVVTTDGDAPACLEAGSQEVSAGKVALRARYTSRSSGSPKQPLELAREV